jgi:ketopantoate reductase
MRLIKMLGLAAFASIAAMAFVGVTTAAAVDNVVLCTKNTSPNLCVAGGGTVLPKGTVVLATNEGTPVLKGVLKEECKSSSVVGETSEEKGNPLNGKVTSVTFTNSCTPCSTVTMKLAPYTSHLNVAAEDKFTLTTLNILAELSKCTFLNLTCNFVAEAVTVNVVNAATGALLETKNSTLNFEGGSGGESLCGKVGTWEASYSTVCHKPGSTENVACWAALET